jgi:3-keto-disaccharide hydrolase
MRWMGLALLVAAAACSKTDSGSMPGPATAPSAGGPGEWVTLFDGSNLDAFDRFGDANWRIEGDTVVADDGAGMLFTRSSYSDFDLEVEFWVDVPANSGVFLRCQDKSDIQDMTCYEVNIFDTRADQTYRTGGIVHIASPSRIMNAAGRWNRYRISAVGTHLEVELNGERIVSVDDGKYSEGPIALQRGAGVVMFRNVRVRPRR